VLCSNSLSSALARLKSANYSCTSEWVSCTLTSIGLVASHQHITLPFSTPQPHALPSADSKATQAANNKESLAVHHHIVWFRTIFLLEGSASVKSAAVSD
jgi:hypothetical protein